MANKSTDFTSDGSKALDCSPSFEATSSDDIQASDIPTRSTASAFDGIQASDISTSDNASAADGNLASDNPTVLRCDTCSRKQIIGYTTENVRHDHFSSKILTDQANEIDTGSSYFCRACNKAHVKFNNSSRRKICVTSVILLEDRQSTVVEIGSGEVSHVDWICIPGARINTLTEAWEIEYINEKKPMDVILIGGLENVKKGKSGPSIVNAFKHFIDLVQWQGEHFHPDNPNTCTIGTLIYPPQMCWFSDDEQVPSTFHNQFRNIRWLNLQIERMNTESGTKSPKFHTLGVRKVTRYGRGQTRHRVEQTCFICVLTSERKWRIK